MQICRRVQCLFLFFLKKQQFLESPQLFSSGVAAGKVQRDPGSNAVGGLQQVVDDPELLGVERV